MTSPPVFQLASTELLPGVSLIEASAGTGKTFTIAGLFLRLLLERGLSVREVLVVTYTVAATEELRGRIRQTLADALKVFETGASQVPFIQALAGKFGGEKREKILLLEQALAGFDEAPIYTIHGFCQRVLQDRAFESASLFDTELVTDQTALLRRVVQDFWRSRILTAGRIPVAFVAKNIRAPEALLPLVNSCLPHHGLEVLSPVEGQELETLAADLTAAFATVQRIWQSDEAQIRACFGSRAQWAKVPYNRDAEMGELFRRVAAGLAGTDVSGAVLAGLEKFTTTAIKQGTSQRGKSPAPKLAFFAACDDLATAERRFILGLQVHALRFVKAELPRRKAALKVQSFDDLLQRLDAALAGPMGAALADALRSQYRAALIDEFQDTDPVQHRIFRRAFAAPSNYLFLIGDPKQAIYGFRGADIFTYLAAKHDARRVYTLLDNWRSERDLVAATNTFFRGNPAAFVFPEVEFHEVQAKGDADTKPLLVAGQREPPFQIWFAPRDSGDLAKSKAEVVLPPLIASEIARLLDGEHTLGDRRLLPEDVAVLVPENRQAQLMQQALTAVGIPSVLLTTGSLFGTREVTEIKRVLAAVAEPANESLLKAALATDLFGRTSDEIEHLTEDESDWQGVLERFRHYLDLWTNEGFIRMFRTLLQWEQVRARLLRFPDGERRLTNVLHLGEVLHQAATGSGLGVGGALKWIVEQENSRDAVAEEHQLRLERDEKAVKLVTIHKSKGLEYPVVFCPFSWRGAGIERNREEVVFFHDPESRQLQRDLGSDKLAEHAARARVERLAENVRLLYVALTRARHRCCFVWGGFNGAETSAPAWLLHPPPKCEPDEVTALQAQWSQLDDARLRQDLENLCARSGGAIAVKDLPDSTDERYQPPFAESAPLSVRPFKGIIRRDWRIASFSSLTEGHDEERPDRLEPGAAPAEEVPAVGMFAFPRGTKAGTCLHKILERVDFGDRCGEATRLIVEEELGAHGLAVTEFAPVVSEMLGKVLTVPLRPISSLHEARNDGRPPHPAPLPLGVGEGALWAGEGAVQGFKARGIVSGNSLSEVAPSQRLNELEFCFPLQRLSAAPLRALWSNHGLAAESERLDFNPVTGLLKGFIDLVFQWEGRYFIVDWKSNWLGNRVEDYGPEALRQVIERRHYYFQYQLYTLALDKYLRLRVPDYRYDQYFGGVFYVFLRGVDPARPGLGLFQDRPAEELVREMGELLSGGGERGGE